MVDPLKQQRTTTAAPPPGRALEVLRVFFQLGLTSFGGPVAHLGYFRHAFVEQRRWVDDHTYADLVALSQFLPGPSSSQVAMALGLLRAGYGGLIAAWVGFTLPSAVALILFAAGVAWIGDVGTLHGFKVVAVAVVANAVIAMMRTLTPDAPRLALAVAGALLAIAIPNVIGQLAVIALGAVVGWSLLPRVETKGDALVLPAPVTRRQGSIAIGLFVLALLALPFLVWATANPLIALLDSFFRTGSLVFGGGHVVLPLLQSEVVPTGWISDDLFVAGYGAAQAVPGPLFTFAAYLGMVIGGVGIAILCLVAIFLPSFFLIIGAFPFWGRVRENQTARQALTGVNAAVVGLLLAALYHPVWTAGIQSQTDLGLAIAAFLLLTLRAPAWLVVVVTAAAVWALQLL
jgi:chromate transporter